MHHNIVSIVKMGEIAPQAIWEQYRVEFANTFIKKLCGLMFRKEFDGGMVFTFKKPTSIMIHTFFMRFNIDVRCYNKKDELIKEVKRMRPWKVMFVKGVKYFCEGKSIYECNDPDTMLILLHP